ncbi:hypothetical protein AGMMS49992_19480 [Clostridia bacterium]|nr:hypothetical protein AGMMS49992_19480 [Clostridia bacterium]
MIATGNTSRNVLVFTKNGIVITPYRSLTAPDYFASHIVFENFTADTFLDMINATKKTVFAMPEQSIIVNSKPNDRYLCVVVHQINENACYGMLIDSGKMASIFSMNELPDDAFLIITDAEGQSITSQMNSGETI